MSLRLPTALLVVSLAAGFSIELPATESERASSALPACDPDDGGLVLPEGFCAVIVADNLGSPRLIDVSANGDIYVHDQGTRGDGENVPGSGVVALRDLDGDGRADVIERFFDHYGTGLQLRGDHLYLSTTTEVYRYAMTPGELVPPGEAELVVGGFPEQRGHADKAFAFDDAGNMYVNVGAPSNACMEFARTRGSAGLDPCPQRVRQASVWRFDAERLGQTQEDDGYQLVTGTRNIVGIGWDPSTRGIYAVQHGRDALGSLWSFDDERNAEIPSEELLRLTDGADFGWPYCYHDRFQGKRLLAPEYGGDGFEVGDCAQYSEPLVAFPGHWAPNDLLFYTGDQFPEPYRNGVFVVFHGSWNRAPLEQGGYQVAFAPRANDEFTGDWQTFADGFKGATRLMAPQDATHRPVGIAQGPDGSVFVTDDVGGRLWRILYTGE
jgi:glucose/arabinose dehydrogenase